MKECINCNHNYYDFINDKFNDDWKIDFCIACQAFNQAYFIKKVK